MRRSILLSCFAILVFSLSTFSAEPPSAAGRWEGSIALGPGMDLGVIVTLDQEGGAWKGTIDIPLQGAKGLPLINIAVDGADATFEISGPGGKPTFKGSLSPDGASMAGDFTQGGQTFPFELKRQGGVKAGISTKTQDEILKDIWSHVEAVMPDWHVPGLAVGILDMRDGKTSVHMQGFGVKDLATGAGVSPATLFAIGSSTKAFTATLMAQAVEKGGVKWDEPVRAYLPDFKLWDESASERMTPRDLLSHRSGLPRHDFMWYGSDLSRAELYERLRYLEPTEDLRSVFQYQNLMFVTAGVLEEKVLGKPWEALVKERIFDPLAMKTANTSVADMQKAADFALPYEWKDSEDLRPQAATAPAKDKKKKDAAKPVEPKREGELKLMPFRVIDAPGPAGSINASVGDMVMWLKANLDGGAFGDKRILSEASMQELHSPQMVVRGGMMSQLFAFPETPYMMYGLGWFIQPYRGHRLIHHGGNIDGFSAMVAFMPDEKIGVVILSNLDGNLMVNSLMFEVFDRLLGLDPVDWNGRFKLKYAQIKEAMKQGESKEDEVRRKPGTKPSHPIADYAGEFDHPAYGRLRVTQEKGALGASLHGIAGPLDHFHYDIFKGSKDVLKGLKFTFLTNLRGDIDRVEVPLEQGVGPIVFTRVPPDSMRDPAFLAPFAGEYEVMGMTATVELKGDTLFLTVPGQPGYTLVPYLGTEFDLKEQKGFSVKFTVKDGKATECVFIQPNGVFIAKKR
jgi:CubicO group peptidase (beta-lactamase class C family)